MIERFDAFQAQRGREIQQAIEQARQATRGPYGAFHRGERVLRVNVEKFDPDKMVAIRALGMEQPPLFPEMTDTAYFVKV